MSAIDKLLSIYRAVLNDAKYPQGDHELMLGLLDPAKNDIADLRSAASEADALRATVAEQARQIETAREIMAFANSKKENVYGINADAEIDIDRLYSWIARWLAANAPTPAPEAEKERAQ